MSYNNIREEELKNRIAEEFFADFDTNKIIGNVDFCVAVRSHLQLSEAQSLLWAEAKKGRSDLNLSLVQLILTIGKARTFDSHLPPAFLGAFDAEKMAFIPYGAVSDIFYLNDFNWKVAPSNHNSKEFLLIQERIQETWNKQSLVFYYESDKPDIKEFVKDNFVSDNAATHKVKIDKNNFMVIYNKWLGVVKPTISVDWELVKKGGIIDGDFYLADLLSNENETLKDKLFVLLKTNHYC